MYAIEHSTACFFIQTIIKFIHVNYVRKRRQSSKASGVLKNEAIIAVMSSTIVAPFVIPKINSLNGHRSNPKRS